MPKIAEGDANKVWVIPSEITKALEGLGSSIHEIAGIPRDSGGPRKRVDLGTSEPAKLAGSGALGDAEVSKANAAVQAAIAEAAQAANPGGAESAEPASPTPPSGSDDPPPPPAPPAPPAP
jgi:hypothetical protein